AERQPPGTCAGGTAGVGPHPDRRRTVAATRGSVAKPMSQPALAPEPPAPNPVPRADAGRIDRFLLVAFFLSGPTGLVFEVVWTRQLVLVFGATSLAVASVLAAYMAGLGLGGFIGGRFAERLQRPLVAYGALEAAVAVYGLSVPLILRALEPLYRAIHHA